MTQDRPQTTDLRQTVPMFMKALCRFTIIRETVSNRPQAPHKDVKLPTAHANNNRKRLRISRRQHRHKTARRYAPRRNTAYTQSVDLPNWSCTVCLLWTHAQRCVHVIFCRCFFYIFLMAALVGQTAERIFTKLSHVVDIRCYLRTY